MWASELAAGRFAAFYMLRTVGSRLARGIAPRAWDRVSRVGPRPGRGPQPPTASYTTPGAGNNTCSIDSARRGSAAVRITTPFNHGSSDEVSKRVGICVTIDVNA